MKSTMLILWTMVLVAAVGAYGIFTMTRNIHQNQQPHAVAVDYRQVAKDNNLGPQEFVLSDQDGELFFSRQLEGKVWIMNYFFATCTQSCLRMNQRLAELQRKFPSDDLIVLSVSCNPELDDPGILHEYAKQFHADKKRWRFVTGNYNEIKQRLTNRYLMEYDRGKHQDKVVVVDRKGEWRYTVNLLDDKEYEQLAKDLRPLLDEQVPPKESRSEENAVKSDSEKKGL